MAMYVNKNEIKLILYLAATYILIWIANLFNKSVPLYEAAGQTDLTAPFKTTSPTNKKTQKK